jgi:hypothetical protein
MSSMNKSAFNSREGAQQDESWLKVKGEKGDKEVEEEDIRTKFKKVFGVC